MQFERPYFLKTPEQKAHKLIQSLSAAIVFSTAEESSGKSQDEKLAPPEGLKEEVAQAEELLKNPDKIEQDTLKDLKESVEATKEYFNI